MNRQNYALNAEEEAAEEFGAGGVAPTGRPRNFEDSCRVINLPVDLAHDDVDAAEDHHDVGDSVPRRMSSRTVRLMKLGGGTR